MMPEIKTLSELEAYFVKEVAEVQELIEKEASFLTELKGELDALQAEIGFAEQALARRKAQLVAAQEALHSTKEAIKRVQM